jgi:enterobactin synthetase component D
VRTGGPGLPLEASCLVAVAFEVEALLAASAALGVELPRQFRQACPRRRAELLAGRWCAAEAMAELTGERLPVGVNEDRSPAWPPGLVGSITHAEGYAAAVVARSSEVLGLGLDTERILTNKAWEGIAGSVMLPEERALQASRRLAPNEFGTLIFSAKESAYKCLFPHAGRVLEFHEVRITEIVPEAGRFTFSLLVGLGEKFPRGFAARGSYRFADGRVHTAVEYTRLPAAPHGCSGPRFPLR